VAGWNAYSRGTVVSLVLACFCDLCVRALCSRSLFEKKKVDEAFKVKEYDEEGNEVLRVSTLDEFEHFWKFYVDFGLGIFAMVLPRAALEARARGASSRFKKRFVAME
jgi:hypothetical protein